MVMALIFGKVGDGANLRIDGHRVLNLTVRIISASLRLDLAKISLIWINVVLFEQR